jgi:hypothetical protein
MPVASILCAALLPLSLMGAATSSDLDGWGGAGWYVSSDSQAASATHGQHPSILFNGPHLDQQACMEIYDKFYSPIGSCRYLAAKP